jgi:hypothetical protein
MTLNMPPGSEDFLAAQPRILPALIPRSPTHLSFLDIVTVISI